MSFKTAKRMESLPFSGIRAVMEKATRMQQQGERVIHMEIGRPDLDTPQKIKDAAYKSLEAGHVFYTSNYGTPKLRETIANWENAHNHTDYSASEVMVTIGVSEATFAAMDAYLEEGDEVLVPDPVWLNYIHVPSSLGAKPVSYSLREENNYQIDFDEFESKITPKTKMVVIVDPSNPTGGVFSRQTVEKLSKIAIERDLIVISDEIYEQLVYDGAKHISVASFPGMKERTIKLGGFSKAYSMTGWRIGYMCASEEIIKACVRVHQYTVTCASSFVQDAAVTAFEECDDDVAAMLSEYQRRRDYVVKALNAIDGISCNNPEGAFYIFVNIKKLGKTSMEMAEYLLDTAKVAMVPGSAFGTGGEGYLRLSYSCSYPDLVEGCARIKEAVEAIKK